MQLLVSATNLNQSSNETARELLEVVPMVMREIRSRMRSKASKYLSVPQFRALTFIERSSGSPLSELATHMGLSLPSASRLVDGLMTRGLMSRQEHPVDRRQVSLTVTRHGLSILNESRIETLSYLAQKMKSTDDSEREAVIRAMEVLRRVFSEPKSYTERKAVLDPNSPIRPSQVR